MNNNPYAAPAPPPGGGSDLPPVPVGVPQPFGATEVVGVAFEHLKRHSGVLIGAIFLMGILRAPFAYTPAGLLVGKVVGPASLELQLVTLVCATLGQVVGGYLGAGFARIGLAIVRQEEPSVGALFTVKGAGRNIGLSFVFGLLGTVATLLRIVAFAVEVPEIVYAANVVLWVGFIPLVFVWLALSQTTYFIVDKDLPLGDAIRASIVATRGRRGEIFLASLLGGLVLFAGAFACGIGMIFTCPIFMMIYPVIYARLTGQDPAFGSNGSLGWSQTGYGAAPGFGPPGGGYGAPPAGGYGGPEGPRY